MKRLVLVLIATSLLLGAAAVLVHAAPVSLHGTIPGYVFDYLQHGPRSPDQPRFFPVRSAYSTLALEAVSVSLPKPASEIPSMGGIPGNASLGLFLHEFQREVGSLGAWFLGFFIGDAAAACGVGGGSCNWIGGTGNFSDGTHWSASSGGVSCACTPAATDTVTFDASSGAGTATQNNASLTTAGLTMSGAGVSIAGGANAWTINGSVSISNAAAFITSLASGNWTVTGSWTNASTSASWSFAAAMGFNSPTNQTMTFCACGGGGTEFAGGVAFSETTATVTFTIAGHTLTAPGGLTVTTVGHAGGIATLSDTANNLGITAGGVTISGSGILKMGSGTLTDSLAWNDSGIAGAFVAGTSTVILSGSGVLLSTANPFYNLTVSGTVTTSASSISTMTVSNNLSVSGTWTVTGAVLTVTVGGNLTVAGTLARASGGGTGFAFTDNAGLTLSLSTKHTVDVNGTDLGTLLVSGTTTVYFRSSFATDALTVSNQVLLAFETQNVSVTWTYNSSDPIATSNAPLYLESVFNGQLCIGQWAFANSSQLRANQVAVCGSTATYPVIVFSGQNLGGNTHWYFGQGGSVGGKASVCTPSWSYTFLGGIVSCATSMQIPPQYVGWYVNGAFRGTGLSWSGFVFEPSPAQGSLTVTTVYASAGSGPSITETTLVQETPNYNLLLYVGSLLILILAILLSNASKDSEGKGPAEGLHFSHNYRYTAIRKDRIGNWLAYRQKDPKRFERGSFVTLRVPAAEDHPELRVIRGRLLPSGRWATQSVREYRPLKRGAS